MPPPPASDAPASPPPGPDTGAAPLLTLDPALDSARVQGVQQPDAEHVVLETHRPGVGAAHWRFSVTADGARLNRTFLREARGGRPPVFCQWLRTRLIGGHIESVTLPQAHLLELRVRTDAVTFRLVLELNRRDSNLLLLDGEGRLLIALRHPGLADRHLGPGDPYVPPPRLHAWPRGVPLEERYPAPDETAARALEARWSEREAGTGLEGRRGPVQKHLRREAKRLERRLAQQQADAAAAADAELWKHRGELLQIHRDRIQPGLAQVEVPDVFLPDAPLVTIPLDSLAEPGANIERCFRQYRRLRAAQPHVAARIDATRTESAAIAALATQVEQAETPAALEALADAVPPALGGPRGALARLLRSGANQAPAQGSRRGAPEPAQGPLRRLSSDGYTILVGRSAAENDRLTFRQAKGRDWWLHAQGIPGSHVVVLNPADGALPPRTLREAAWLAAYYSQARAAAVVEVDCTQRKHVRRIKGGEPGQVTYAHNRTVAVRPDDAELRRVLERTEDSR